VFEVTYSKGLTKSGTTIRPFLWRAGDNGQVEVHLPWVDPTNKADKTLFGTGADKSDPTVKKSNGQKMYYVGSDKFPFAFYLDGVDITEFQNTILKRENESKRIDKFFPDFLEWSVSDGMKSTDWYLHHLDSEIIETTE
jgi:LruC domain-containing protein